MIGAPATMCKRRVVLIIILFSQIAFAQDQSTATKAASSTSGSGSSTASKAKASSGDKRTTSINFEDELVEGEVKKPELLYLLQKKQFNFKRLIKLRENFIPEMNRTAEEIGRGRGQN
jgi:hypothetical protein